MNRNIKDNKTSRSSKFASITSWGPANSIIVTVGGFIASQIFAVFIFIIVSLILGWNLDTASDRISQSPWITLAFSATVYGVYLYIIKKFLSLSNHTIKDLGLKATNSKLELFYYTFGGFAAYFFLALITSIAVERFAPEIDLNQRQDLGIDFSTTGVALIPVFLSLVIIPPLVEEIVCRGFLYTGLRKKMGILLSGLITGVIFGIAHLQWGGEAPLLWAAAIDTFVLSWVLVYVREKSDSLYPAVGIHMIKNGLAFLALFVFRI